ncbi:hypothetical protein Pmani_029596 [Petrolisthes manimaculis]|uniref:Uncharacterized protein n=1 Tax=Petrolisthes manimaculis TaxID=1843537 RepID=A0AAE1TWU7_9EUCA|nr:hypothetical protein Pmani_029596 [Petrolisthes manimaculis]
MVYARVVGGVVVDGKGGVGDYYSCRWDSSPSPITTTPSLTNTTTRYITTTPTTTLTITTPANPSNHSITNQPAQSPVFHPRLLASYHKLQPDDTTLAFLLHFLYSQHHVMGSSMGPRSDKSSTAPQVVNVGTKAVVGEEDCLWPRVGNNRRPDSKKEMSE